MLCHIKLTTFNNLIYIVIRLKQINCFSLFMDFINKDRNKTIFSQKSFKEGLMVKDMDDEKRFKTFITCVGLYLDNIENPPTIISTETLKKMRQQFVAEYKEYIKSKITTSFYEGFTFSNNILVKTNDETVMVIAQEDMVVKNDKPTGSTQSSQNIQSQSSQITSTSIEDIIQITPQEKQTTPQQQSQPEAQLSIITPQSQQQIEESKSAEVESSDQNESQTESSNEERKKSSKSSSSKKRKSIGFGTKRKISKKRNIETIARPSTIVDIEEDITIQAPANFGDIWNDSNLLKKINDEIKITGKELDKIKDNLSPTIKYDAKKVIDMTIISYSISEDLDAWEELVKNQLYERYYKEYKDKKIKNNQMKYA